MTFFEVFVILGKRRSQYFGNPKQMTPDARFLLIFIDFYQEE